MSATTSEGTGLGSVERYVPRIYNQQIRASNIIGLQEAVKEVSPRKIDGGELKAMVMNLSSEEIEIILRAAEILKKI